MKKRTVTTILPSLCLIACAFCRPASADIIVDVQDASIAPGGTGFVDVLISSTGTDDIYSADYAFEIAGISGPASSLEFSVTQLNSESSLENYVFGVDSDDLFFDRESATRLLGSDALDGDGDKPVSITGSTLLLARLELTHDLLIGSAADAIGDQFSIVLVADTDPYDPNGIDGLEGTTLFDVGGSVFADITSNSFAPVGLGGGTITVTAAAVPEPASVALVFCLISGVTIIRRRRVLAE